MLTSGTVTPNIRNSYKSLIGLCLTAVWASFGNLAYSENGWGKGFDWCFLTGSTFPFIPSWLMPFVVIACTFGMVMVVYGIYYAVVHFMNKHSTNGVTV